MAREIVYSLWWVVESEEDGRAVTKRYGQWTDANVAAKESERARTTYPDTEFMERVGYSEPPYDDPHGDPAFVERSRA